MTAAKPHYKALVMLWLCRWDSYYLDASATGCRWVDLPSGDVVRVDYFYQWGGALCRWEQQV